MTHSRRHSRKRINPLLIAIVMLVVAGGIWAATSLFTKGDNGRLSSPEQSANSKGGGKHLGGKPSESLPSADGSKTSQEDLIDTPTSSELDKTYDVVIAGGRVINPETKLDREGLNVAVQDGQIALVTDQPLKGKRVIDAKGLVVAPGFIDNLSYDPNPIGVWNKIADGVTTNIAMHGGTASPEKWYPYYERNKTPVHFGASFFYTQARNQFKLSRYDTAKPEQTQTLVDQAEKALNNGVLGISFSLEYVPGVNDKEILPLMKLAHKYNVPVYFHARYSAMEGPGTNIDALNELLGYARASGAAVHIDHINSTGGTFSMQQSLKMVSDAIEEGLDITSCIYPYDYWGTYLNSARFDEGWQQRFRISYNDLQIAGTKERLTAETFRKYQKEGKLAVAYAIPKQDVIDSLQAPFVMIGSDAILEPGFNNHPRASGTFARTVGLYVREQQVITISDAIAKMSLLPAQRLEKQAPALQKKGRIAKGMDADIVVFDYDTISDKSTVEKPEIVSAGIAYVLVNGQVALDEKGIHKDIRAGQPIKSEFLRVKSGNAKLDWEGGEVALLEYRGNNYIDLEALKAHGYTVKWDEIKHEATVTGGAAADRVDVPKPKVGELMLERGYQLAWEDGNRTELLSVDERNYVPLSALQEHGWKLTKDGTNYTMTAA
ncbi:amidohydrolase family protein [Cohnella terricola]|uniref:Amidohydrolase family protein n=1 Tax=Cohnella terricola TaxID=1289167 RepID=A0A559JJ94_9BACL|nr:amidohydrolase family protein [Cohnella terricola]TVX99945.1 amidohydrolase family protein [Cohnella terricola]